MLDEAKTAGNSRKVVQEFVAKQLYPTDTPEFEVGVITVFSYDDMWWSYLDTTLPDDMLYVVCWKEIGGTPELTAYKKWEPDG